MAEYSVHIVDGLGMFDGSSGALPPPPAVSEGTIVQAMEVVHEEIVFLEELVKSLTRKDKEDD